ncbi:MAG: V-type ATP synthase subunit F [Candidatus Helarchaeota archaeon]
MWIHVIGDRDTVIGFKLVGVPGTIISGKREARQLINSFLLKEDFGILIITEKIYEDLQTYINKIKTTKRIPLIIEVPDRSGPRDYLALEHTIKSAIGFRI